MNAPVVATKGSVLLVDDDLDIREIVGEVLTDAGYRVVAASNGAEAFDILGSCHPDLILLDLMLPGLDGIQICRLLRRDSTVPIIMLTALGGEGDRVAGLDTGADDYLAKPFGMRELLARVRALLRRSASGSQPPVVKDGALVSGDLALDRERREATRAGKPLRMKPKEFELLLFFAQHPGRVFTREQILDEVWGLDFYGGPRTVDVHVRWLRQKIEADPANPDRIKTVRGSGYLFEG